MKLEAYLVKPSHSPGNSWDLRFFEDGHVPSVLVLAIRRPEMDILATNGPTSEINEARPTPREWTCVVLPSGLILDQRYMNPDRDFKLIRVREVLESEDFR